VHKAGHVSTGSLNKPFQSGFASNGKKFNMGNSGTGANFKGNGRTDANPSINFGPGPGPTRKCFKCGSLNHLRPTCPNLSGRPGTLPTARSSNQPANIKRVSMSHEDHVHVGENISDDLHTDRPMMTLSVMPANNYVMPIVQRVQHNIIDDRAIQCNDESNKTTKPVHVKWK